MNIGICGYENIWIEYTEILQKNDINVCLMTVLDFNDNEHLIQKDKEVLNLSLLNKGIVPDYYSPGGLDKKQLTTIYHYQIYFDLMFDRQELNANKPKLSSFEKNQIITNLIDYYLYILKEKNLDFVMFSNIPHNIFDFSLYIACIMISMRTLLLRKEAFNTIHISENFFDENYELNKALKQRNQVIVNYEEIESYIRQLEDSDYKKIQPDYMKKQEAEKNKGSLIYFIKKVFSINPLLTYKYFFIKDKICTTKITCNQKFLEKDIKCTNIPYFIKMVESFFFKKKLSREYRKYSKTFSAEELEETLYVYLALHYQPEATSLPTGEVFTNQMNIIRLLSSSLPKNWKLIVREHPSQLMGPLQGSGGRWLSFYKYVKTFDNVMLASLGTDQIDLINHTKCLATISGTVGIEALARKKKVMIFGSAWYENLKAVKRISSHQDIKNFLDSLEWSYEDNKEMIEEIYNIFSLNFKNELRNDNSGIRDCYIKAIIFYIDYIQNEKKND